MAVAIFAVTYLAVAAGRLPWLSVDRPSAALLGAVFMVAAGEPRLLWLATALASTLAGNLTVIGSVANVIVLDLAGSRGRIGFWRFLAIGAVVTSTTLAVGLAILLGERALGL